MNLIFLIIIVAIKENKYRIKENKYRMQHLLSKQYSLSTKLREHILKFI